jgi:D-amino-acid dehydrogenase
MEVLVLGAGIIGMSTAYYLNAAGHRVTVIDRNDSVGLETSYANGGQLSYSYVAPLAGPGVLAKVPKWLTRDDSPIRFQPSLNLDQWRWCMQFMLACTRKKSDTSTRQLLTLSFLSRTLMHQLIRQEPTLEFDYVQSGKLVLHRDANTYKAAVELLDFQKSLGCEQQALSRDACIEREPALADTGQDIAGGIFTSSEDTADCYRFCKGLEKILRQRGIRVPIYPLKGYSLTVPTTAASTAPTISVTDFSRKIVYARIGNSLRVAGMADLVGYSTERDVKRLKTLRKESEAVFPYAGDYAAASTWSGLRPATPKGIPIIGPTSFKNLWLNIGHGALGFTLATGSAQLLSDWIDGKPAMIDRQPFNLRH